jgi:acetylcholinesterase
MKELNENFNNMAPLCFCYIKGVKNPNVISEALRKYYLPLDPIDERSFIGLAKLMSDGFVGYPIHKFVHFVSNQVDVYYYKFSFPSRFGFRWPNTPYGIIAQFNNCEKTHTCHYRLQSRR